VLLFTTTVGGLVAVAHVGLTDPTYEASARVLVGGRQLPTGSPVGELMPTYAALVSSDIVLGRTSSKLGLSSTPAELRARVRANVDGQTRILEITVADTNGGRAAEITNEIAATLAGGALAAGVPASRTVDVEVLEPARRGARVRPNGTVELAAGLLAGALVGAAIVLRPGRKRVRKAEARTWTAGPPARDG
jgi:capsular polysaccharide biosynthesis protein